MEFKVGERLPNDAFVDRYAITDIGITVLAFTGIDDATPWVTWCLDKRKNAYWGHYFSDRDKANEDFRKRAI